MIEGPQNDAISIMGMASNFERVRLLSFGFSGTLFEQLNQTAASPYSRALKYFFTGPGGGPSPIPVQEATAVFSELRAIDRADPDSAVVAYRLGDAYSNSPVLTAHTGYQRGWFFAPIIVAVGLSICVQLDQTLTEGRAVDLNVEVDRGGLVGLIDIQGTVITRNSLIGH
ncbi:MAG: hypothetical protein LC808_19185 [Actinobacteria bacterium]|nr:hypothetical protein [Actinomycetota bacterium]